MSRDYGDARVVVLAAGKGKRMESELPKVLHLLNGRSLIEHVLAAVAEANVDPRPAIVVGYRGEDVANRLPAGCQVILQHEQRGTGHAVQCALGELGACENVLVLYGDMPLVSSRTIRHLVETHARTGSVLTMTTITVPDFNDWRASLYDYGRVLRDGDQRIIGIREVKDASANERLIQEVNPSQFMFSASWLKGALPLLTPANAQAEYYLTDLAGIACREGRLIANIPCPPEEGLGINTPAQLLIAQQIAT